MKYVSCLKKVEYENIETDNNEGTNQPTNKQINTHTHTHTHTHTQSKTKQNKQNKNTFDSQVNVNVNSRLTKLIFVTRLTNWGGGVTTP